jgi:hypothetical protein
MNFVTFLDLCWYRYLTVVDLKPHILPYGIRDLIKQYVLFRFDNETIRKAVRLWCQNRNEAISRYGHISQWDVKGVTNMSKWFRDGTRFDDDISGVCMLVG